MSGPHHIKLIQGLLWQPLGAETALPELLSSFYVGARTFIDPVRAPFAFFENGEPAASQQFYQLTLVATFEELPSEAALQALAQAASEELGFDLEQTPAGVGWQLWGDLRPV